MATLEFCRGLEGTQVAKVVGIGRTQKDLLFSHVSTAFNTQAAAVRVRDSDCDLGIIARVGITNYLKVPSFDYQAFER